MKIRELKYQDKGLEVGKDVVALGNTILRESQAQIKKWGYQKHSLFEWLTYTTEELGELAQQIGDFEYNRGGTKEHIKREAIQTATLCIKIAKMIMEKQEC